MSLGEIGAKLAGSPHRKWLTLSTTGEVEGERGLVVTRLDQ